MHRIVTRSNVGLLEDTRPHTSEADSTVRNHSARQHSSLACGKHDSSDCAYVPAVVFYIIGEIEIPLIRSVSVSQPSTSSASTARAIAGADRGKRSKLAQRLSRIQTTPRVGPCSLVLTARWRSTAKPQTLTPKPLS